MSKLFSFKTSSVLFPDIFLQQRVDVLCVGVGVGAAKEVSVCGGGGLVKTEGNIVIVPLVFIALKYL